MCSQKRNNNENVLTVFALRFLNVFLVIFLASSKLCYGQSLTTSLVACYGLDGNGAEPVNALTGTLNNVYAATDRFNNISGACQFSGTASSYISLPNNTLLKPTNGISFSAWIKTTSTSNQYVVFAHNGCTSYHEGYTMGVNWGGTGMVAGIVKSAASCTWSLQPVLYSSATFSTNVWTHLGFYMDNDSMKIYVNGQLSGSLASTVQMAYNTSANVYLGGSNVTFNLPYFGSMDNVRFYNRKLSNAEFAQLYASDPSCSLPPLPTCSNTVYAISNSGTMTPASYYANINTPSSITGLQLSAPAGSDGLAIGPAFSFTAPNPTYWAVSGGTYWYYNGSTFVNTNHTAGNANAVHPGSSTNKLYNIDPTTGNIYAYSGTGNASLLTTITSSPGDLCADIVGDNNDNFYILRTSSPQALNVYNSTGNFICSYSVTGVPTTTGATALALAGNTVGFVSGGMNYTGTISSGVINFTTSSFTFPVPTDYATCANNTAFTSTISSSPGPSVSCSTPTVTLSLNAPPPSLSYTWSGPGIVSSANGSTIAVNAPGVYTCISRSCMGGTSSAVYTVLNGVAPATVIANGGISCSSPTVQLFVFPGPPNTFSWSGPGIVGTNNTQIITVNAGGIYTAVSTDSNGCSMTNTVSVASSISALTINVSPTSGNICMPSVPLVTVTAGGASSYTWLPGGAVFPISGSSVVALGPTVSTTYTVLGSTGACSGSTLLNISVANSPTLLNVTGNPTICSGTSTILTISGASSYVWQPGSLSGSNVTVNPTSTTIYTVTGSNGSCTSSTTVTITVVPSPTISVIATAPTICSGGSSSLAASIGGTMAATFTWQPVNVVAPAVVVSPTSSTIYTVTTDNGFCSSSKTVAITVIATPTLSISANPTIICAGNSALLSANGASVYNWQPGGMSGNNVNVNPTSTTVYTVSGSTLGCSSSQTVQVIVNPAPILNASASPVTVCAGSSSTLGASGANTYTWFPMNIPGQTISVTPSLTTTYTVIGTGSLGCNGSATVTVFVQPLPVVGATANPSGMCAGSVATLSANGAGSYVWQPGNISGASPTVAPSSSTIYTVTGTSGLCSSANTVSITVSPAPSLTVSPVSLTTCPGYSFMLTASGAGNYSWQPGGVSGTSVIMTAFSPITIYTVTGYNGPGCFKTETVMVSAFSPVISASVAPTFTCAGQARILSASGASSYTWLPGPLVGQSVTVTPLSTTVYTVTGMNATGCLGSYTISVPVSPNPNVGANISPNPACAGSQITFVGTGASTYTWYPLNVSGQTVTLTANASGPYTVVGTSSLGCTGTYTFYHNVLPLPSISITGPSVICAGNSAQLIATGGSGYYWQPGGLTGPIVNVSPSSATLYSVTAIGSNSCSGSAVFVMLVNPLPNVTITPASATVCPGQPVILNASGASTYSWQPGNITGSFITVTTSTTKTYSVDATDANGCMASKSATVFVSQNPVVTISSFTNTICEGASLSLSVTGAQNYTWYPGGATGSVFNINPLVSTVYSVNGTAGPGCTGSALYSVSVAPNPTVIAYASSFSVCEGGSVILHADGANQNVWFPSTFLNNIVGSTVIATPTSNVSYTVTGTTLAGCSDTAVVTLSVSAAPQITLIASTDTICQGQSVILNGFGASSYSLLPGGSTGNSFTVTPTVSSIYTLSGDNPGGCAGTTFTYIVVVPVPQLSVNPLPASICNGDTINLTASGATSYTWMPQGQTGALLVVTPTATSVFTLTGINLGCEGSLSFSVNVVNCQSSLFGLTNAASDPILVGNKYYRVRFTITAVNTSPNIPLQNVTLNSALQTTFPDPCTYTVISGPMITSANSALHANVMFDGRTQMSITSPNNSTLNISTRDTLEYTVLVDPHGFSGFAKNQVIGFAEQPDLQIVSDTSNNGFVWDPDHDGDPTNNNEITLINLKPIDIFIPEGFTPNGDGINDLLVIQGLGNKNARITIFNRWGSKVYVKDGQDGLSWDGKANSGFGFGDNKLPQGIYYYVLELNGSDTQTITGFVVLQY